MNEKGLQRWQDKQRGAALLELAILLPLLIVVLFGFVELGRALMQTNSLNKAVTAGARYVARKPDAVSETTDTNGNVVCSEGSLWSAVTAEAEDLIENDNAGNLILPGLQATFVTPPRAEQSVGVCLVRVEASAPFAPILGDSLVPFFQVGPITIHAQAEERYIGE